MKSDEVFAIEYGRDPYYKLYIYIFKKNVIQST